MRAKTYFSDHVSVGLLDFFSLRWTKKFNFRGTNAYGDLYLELLFRRFKVIRQHAMLHDAGGAKKAHSG